jgi:hypothetical protein
MMVMPMGGPTGAIDVKPAVLRQWLLPSSVAAPAGERSPCWIAKLRADEFIARTGTRGSAISQL